MNTKYTLIAGVKEFELKENQSPNGLRHNDIRPTELKIEVNESFDRIGLLHHINYLISLSKAMAL